MSKNPFGLSFFSLQFKKLYKPVWDLVLCLSISKDYGFNSIEIPLNPELFDIDYRQVMKAAAAKGVDIYSVHLPKDMFDRFKYYDIKKIISCLEIIHPKIAVGHPSTDTQFHKKLVDLKGCLPSNTVLSIENIFPYEIMRQQGTLDTDIGITVDFHHAYLTGSSPIRDFKLYGKKVNHLHIRDYSYLHNSFYTSPGNGSINYQEIFRYLHDTGYQKNMILECPMKTQTELLHTKTFLDEQYDASKNALNIKDMICSWI